MGSDKAFLRYRGKPFITTIAQEMRKVSSDLIVAIGDKERGDFESVLAEDVRVINDTYSLGTPVGGMLTGLVEASCKYAAVLACDLPLVRSDVIGYLQKRARTHSAAIPIWEDEKRVEPLCGVYEVRQARSAAQKVAERGLVSCRDILDLLPDVCYVGVSELRRYDGNLTSLTNINTKAQYAKISRR